MCNICHTETGAMPMHHARSDNPEPLCQKAWQFCMCPRCKVRRLYDATFGQPALTHVREHSGLFISETPPSSSSGQASANDTVHGRYDGTARQPRILDEATEEPRREFSNAIRKKLRVNRCSGVCDEAIKDADAISVHVPGQADLFCKKNVDAPIVR